MKLVVIFLFVTLACKPPDGKEKTNQSIDQPPVLACENVNIWNTDREKLTIAYANEHYGKANYHLDSQAMVVVHFTVIPTLQQTLEYFKPAELDKARTNIAKFSDLNVGVHFVVAPNGDIYCLLPENVMGRHLIGFNHVSIGIENVAADAQQLTQAQLEANAAIVSYLAQKYSSLTYLIGHHEYDRRDLPHYQLIKADNPAYQPYPKHDPGKVFMQKLREILATKNNLELLP